MGSLSLTLLDRNLVPLPTIPGPITSVKSARIILSEMDQFSAHDVTLGADARRTLLTMAPFTVIRFDEKGIGTVAYAVIHDPQQQIQDSGDTITISPPNLTDQLAQYSIGLGAAYQGPLGTIVGSIGNTTPTGETVVVRNTTDGTVIAYVQYAGTTLTAFHPNGNLAAIYPGSGTNLPLYTDTGAVKGYVTVTATGLTVLDTSFVAIASYVPTNEVTGWSASMLDDGPNVASAAPCDWRTVYGNVTITGNSVRKNAGLTNAFDGVSYAPQPVNALANGARSDAALSWQSPNALGQYVAGLADTTGISHFTIRFGFWIQQTAGVNDLSGNPQGVWNIWESGALTTSGVYIAGARFQVSLDYSSGVAVANYWVNDRLVYTSAATPALPLQPLFVGAIPNSEVDNAIITRTVTPSQRWWTARWDQASPVEALLDLAPATREHVRQGDVAAVATAKTLIFGQFGADSGITLTSANGGDPNAIRENPDKRLVETLTWKPESSKVINTVTPLGASTGDVQVDLERCWQIINDPTYPGYGKYGPNTPGTIFPEYESNYPIKMRTTRDGHFEYFVRDMAAFQSLGFEVRGKYTDSQFQYVDSTAASQELTARALYFAVVAKLKWESQVHHTLSVTTAGAFRPPAAGDRVTVDFRKLGQDTEGNFTAMNTKAMTALANPYVMQVARNYNANGDTHDDWTLSNLGFHPGDTNQRGAAATLKQLEAVTITPINSTDTFVISDQSDVDANASADHSCTTEIFIGKDVFRVTRVTIRVVFANFRQQVKTAENNPQTFTITIPHDVQHDIAGGTHDGTGFVSNPNTIGGMPLHYHNIAVVSGNHSAPTATTDYLTVISSGGQLVPAANNGTTGAMRSNTQIIVPDLAASSHPHTTPMARSLTVATTLTADLPLHTHPITAELHDVSQPALATLAIDSGDGTLIDRTAFLVDEGTNASGPWTSSFTIYDASKYIFAPGKVSRVQIKSLATSGNPTGLGKFKAFYYVQVEHGGVGQRIIAAS